MKSPDYESVEIQKSCRQRRLIPSTSNDGANWVEAMEDGCS